MVDKEQILNDYQERISICTFDGNLPENLAVNIARKQIEEYYGTEGLDIINQFHNEY